MDGLMTFQVALFGSEGFVFASDTCTNSRARPDGVLPTCTTSKITQKPGIAGMCAGDDYAKDMLDAVIAKANGAALTNDLLTRIGQCVFERIPTDTDKRRVQRQITLATNDFNGWCMAVDYNDWDCQGNSGCYPRIQCREIRPKHYCRKARRVVAGDISNPARFIIDRYWDNQTNGDTLPSMKKLAAHAVLTAETFSQFVNGLEMVVGDASGIHHLDEKEIENLTTFSKSVHNKIEDFFI
jgi:hypothetical protein